MLLMRDSLVYKLQIRDSLGYKRPWVRERGQREGIWNTIMLQRFIGLMKDSLGYVTTRANATHEILWVKYIFNELVEYMDGLYQY